MQEFETTTITVKLPMQLRKKAVDYSGPHPLLEGFKSISVTHRSIARTLKVSETAISFWMNGKYPVPWNREQQLFALYEQLTQWKKNQIYKKIEESEPQRKAIKCGTK